jgi:hypothetical protein
MIYMQNEFQEILIKITQKIILSEYSLIDRDVFLTD